MAFLAHCSLLTFPQVYAINKYNDLIRMVNSRTAFLIHICLFTRVAILLGIESAPLSEDEDVWPVELKKLPLY